MSLYEKIFKKPYPNGWKDKPNKTTPIKGSIMDAYDAVIEHIESGLGTFSNLWEQLDTKTINDVAFSGTDDIYLPSGRRWWVGSNEADTAGWYKFLTIMTLPTNESLQLVLAVTNVYSQISHGVVHIAVRGGSSATLEKEQSSIKWMYRSGTFLEGDIIAIADGSTLDFYIYQRQSQYGSIQFQVISEGLRTAGISYQTYSYGGSPAEGVNEYSGDLKSADGGNVYWAQYAQDADYAERAYCDVDGNDISDTYLKIKDASTASVTITNNLLATVAGTALDAVQGKKLDDKITKVDEAVGIETRVIDGVPNWRERGADTWSPFSGGLSELAVNLRAYACGDLECLSQGYNYLTIPSESIESVEIELTDFDWYEGSEADCYVRVSKCQNSGGSSSVVLDSLHVTASGATGTLVISKTQIDSTSYPYIQIYVEVYNANGDTIWATCNVTLKFS